MAGCSRTELLPMTASALWRMQVPHRLIERSRESAGKNPCRPAIFQFSLKCGTSQQESKPIAQPISTLLRSLPTLEDELVLQ